jgi:hypothetical protein
VEEIVTSEAARGRRIILTVSAALVLPSAALFVLSRPPRGVATLRLAIAVAMSALMIRGYSWARTWVAVGLGVAGLLVTVIGLLAALRFWWGFVFLLLPPLYFWGAWTLWRSPSVEAYLEHCERKRNPDMSFSSTDRS